MSDLPPSNLPPPPPSMPLSVPPPNQPPPGYQPPPPGYAPPPQGSPGQIPPGIMPMAVAGAGLGLGAQIYAARSSIVVGVIGIIVPIGSLLITGSTAVYFYILPVFGLIYGVRAMMRGAVLGGAIGVGLNVLAGLASLLASGLIGG